MYKDISALPGSCIDKVISAYLDPVCAEFSGADHCPGSACINLVSCLYNSGVDDGAGMDYDSAVVFSDSASPYFATVVDYCGKQCIGGYCSHHNFAAIGLNDAAVYYLGVIGCHIYLYGHKSIRVHVERHSFTDCYPGHSFRCYHGA